MERLKINKSYLSLKLGDITKEKSDAIVNAANSSLLGGGGVDGAIHRAGGEKILEECKAIRAKQGGCPTGKAVITTGGNLFAKYVIHTVGPIWKGGNSNESELLASCYNESLNLALKYNIKTISFPSISTGAYGYPLEEASKIAINTVVQFLKSNEGIDEVCFVLFDERTFQYYFDALDEISKRI